MIDVTLSRRMLLAGAATTALAAPAILSGTRPARAAAPMLGAATPTFNRVKLGEFEVTTLLDATRTMDGPHPIFGENQDAARHAGIPVTATFLRVALISGALAGLAGVGEVAGLKGYLTADLSPGFGYAGIVVAMLAGLSPLGVVVAALFVAGVFVGADSMSRAIGVSNYLADLVVATSLIAVLVSGLFVRYRVRLVGRGQGGSAA